MQPNANQAQPRVARGDGWAVLGAVRFFLALVVAATHLELVMGARAGWLDVLAHCNGAAAVVGFFVISGYSICHSLSVEPEGFFARRFWRLVPTYLLCFAIAALVIVVWMRSSFDRGDHVPGFGPPWTFVLNALCLQGIVTYPIVNFQQSWSLHCEVLYYAAAPMLWRCSKVALAGLIGLSLFAFALRNILAGMSMTFDLWDMNTWAFAWAWLAGFAYYRFRMNPFATLAFIVAPVVLSMLDFKCADRFTVVTVGAAMMAVVLGDSVRLNEGVATFLKWLGDISFPLYMCHWAIYPVVYAVFAKAHSLPWLVAHPGAYLLAVFTVSVLILHAFERPIRALHKRRAPGVQPEVRPIAV